VDLPPDEAIVFKGHPSWRALITFYAAGVGGALAITVVAARVNRDRLGDAHRRSPGARDPRLGLRQALGHPGTS
jgi:hypothetical protein